MAKPAKFVEKTYQIVNDPANNDIILWNNDGSTFIVWNPTAFSGDLLKKHFKSDNFTSFHRQLNLYGFRKVNYDRWEFSNELFQRGQTRLLCDIRPIPSKEARSAVLAVTVAAAPPLPQGTSSPSPPLPQGTGSPSISGDEQAISSKLIDDNERLRKENSQLHKELSEMRNMCNNIYPLISNYTNKLAETGSQVVKLLDLLSLKWYDGGETSVHDSGSQ
ncbi:hypothetical protein RHMOL_Rhmol10G0242600 [Rhododendron molle]|uniref:Uncharacterized protein n=1 Tax=Rhododendron molle TaxID=49168 RepID=A0ACC0M5U0_RHOML|nr:hypothetical protein RHMOL_Rhmol10G0242600 [Rhododendron molle]